MNEALRTEFLEAKVAELEKAMSDAEIEIQEVVVRMNIAQFEVAELQREKYVSGLFLAFIPFRKGMHTDWSSETKL